MLERISAAEFPSHAYIISGSANAAPQVAADYFAQKLMRRSAIESSVDYWMVTSDKSISIDAIRDLKTNVRFGPTEAPYLIATIDPADRMTPEAGNALLKILEEPPANVIFLLVTTYPDLLLPTIHSRCQQINCFALPDASSASDTQQPSISDILAMSLIQRLEVAANMAQQKDSAKETIGFWIEELAQKQALSQAEQKLVKILIEKLNTFKYNVNLKLHLETVMIEIDREIGTLQ